MNMKTIEIKNCTNNRDNLFKVFVNGEKHVVRFRTKIQVPDDKPFEIRVKYFWGGSLKYTFEPKDNMSLQISINRRMMNWSLVSFIAGLVLSFVIVYFYGNVRFISFASCLAPLFLAIHQSINRKKFFLIKEVV